MDQIPYAVCAAVLVCAQFVLLVYLSSVLSRRGALALRQSPASTLYETVTLMETRIESAAADVRQVAQEQWVQVEGAIQALRRLVDEQSVRIGNLYEEIGGVQASLAGVVTSAQFESYLNAGKDRHKKIVSAIEAVNSRIQELAATAAPSTENPDLKEAVAALEKSVASLLVSVEAKLIREDLSGTLQALSQDVADLKGDMAMVGEVAAGVSASASRLAEIEGFMGRLAEEAAAQQEAPGRDREERIDQEARISSQSSVHEVAAREETGFIVDVPGRRGPRVISPEGRAKYREVVDLWAQGHDLSAIAMMTSLDIAEIELMVAGEEPRERSR